MTEMKKGDMTCGNAYKQILLFTVPIFLGNLFQQFYSMADSVIVGRTVSTDAMTGVSSTGSINFLVLGLVLGLTAGFSVVVSNAYGAGDMKGVRRAVGNSLVLCAVLGAVITVIAAPLAGPLLRLMNTPAQYFDYAYNYLFVIFCGIGASVLYNITSAILRAVGDSKTPLFFLIMSALLNIGLDLLFIIVFKLHKTGAGLATVISQLLSGVVCLIYMLVKYPMLRPTRDDLKLRPALSMHLIGIGLPMALQYAITAVGCIFRQASLNTLNGEMPGIVTAFAASAKIESILAIPYNSFGAAMATYAGQNYGAKKFDRIRQGVFISMIYCVISWIVLWIGSTLSVEFVINLFIDKNSGDAILYFPQMMAYSKEFVLYFNMFFPFLAAVMVYRCALQSIGKSASTMIAGTLELIARTFMVFFMVKYIGYPAILFGEVTAWIAADLFLVPQFYVTISRLGSKPLGKRIFSRELDS